MSAGYNWRNFISFEWNPWIFISVFKMIGGKDEIL